MDKTAVRQQILSQLERDRELALAAALTAREAATHEENIAENKYDTLALEAGYLAEGQSKRLQEIIAALQAWQNMPLRTFDDETPIQVGALVTLEDTQGQQRALFLGPDAAGLRVSDKGKEIMVITARSPIGTQLIGKLCGEDVQQGSQHFVIEGVI